MIKRIQQKAKEIFPEIQMFRRHLHQYPELSFEEFKTAKFIESELCKMGIPFQSKIAGTGIIAFIHGKNKEKKCIALRADMDALPIQEKNLIPYASKNDGVMHACGHDVHTACLIGAAKILIDLKDQFEGTIKLIFQLAEEKSPGGASLMIKEGVLENPQVEHIIGLHVDPSLPVGTIGFKAGQYMASADEIHVNIKGKGGHAAMPHQTVDPISIAAVMINSLQQVISRKNNPTLPSVLSFGKIQGGHTTNVIPDSVVLAGTFRTFDEQWRKEAKRLIKQICDHTALAFDATVDINFPEGYPCLINDEEKTGFLKEKAQNYLSEENIKNLPIRMSSEDFSFYTQQIPGTFFRLGTNHNNEQFMHAVHTPYFDIDEKALEIGAGLMAYFALESLKT